MGVKITKSKHKTLIIPITDGIFFNRKENKNKYQLRIVRSGDSPLFYQVNIETGSTYVVKREAIVYQWNDDDEKKEEEEDEDEKEEQLLNIDDAQSPAFTSDDEDHQKLEDAEEEENDSDIGTGSFEEDRKEEDEEEEENEIP